MPFTSSDNTTPPKRFTGYSPGNRGLRIQSQTYVENVHRKRDPLYDHAAQIQQDENRSLRRAATRLAQREAVLNVERERQLAEDRRLKELTARSNSRFSLSDRYNSRSSVFSSSPSSKSRSKSFDSDLSLPSLKSKSWKFEYDTPPPPSPRPKPLDDFDFNTPLSPPPPSPRPPPLKYGFDSPPSRTSRLHSRSNAVDLDSFAFSLPPRSKTSRFDFSSSSRAAPLITEETMFPPLPPRRSSIGSKITEASGYSSFADLLRDKDKGSGRSGGSSWI